MRGMGEMPPRLRQYTARLWCPDCHGDVELTPDAAALGCTTCALRFSCDDGIPRLYWPTRRTMRQDVTDVVRAFYEKTPFPNYDGFDSPDALRRKAQQGVFARLLDEQIPSGAKILEVGCGTGQLSNFLGLRHGRVVFGTDLCVSSLHLGDQFREKHDIDNVVFLQQNLFEPAVRPASFDVVIANGVLHHTGDPHLGFRSILTLLKPNGIIVVGLYNTYGRLTTDARRLVFRVAGDRFSFLDPRLRRRDLDAVRKRAWFMDQYKHPHESKHTIGEVLDWFDAAGVKFLNGIPKCAAGQRLSRNEPLFKASPRGTALDHAVVQLGMVFTGSREGGFFVMIGQKQ